MDAISNSYTLHGVRDSSDTFWQDGSSFASATATDGTNSPGVSKDTFKQIFRDHGDAFKARYPRFTTPDYDIAVQKMLDCGDPEKIGYTQYRCLSCGENAGSPSPANLPFACPVPSRG